MEHHTRSYTRPRHHRATRKQNNKWRRRSNATQRGYPQGCATGVGAKAEQSLDRSGLRYEKGLANKPYEQQLEKNKSRLYAIEDAGTKGLRRRRKKMSAVLKLRMEKLAALPGFLRVNTRLPFRVVDVRAPSAAGPAGAAGSRRGRRRRRRRDGKSSSPPRGGACCERRRRCLALDCARRARHPHRDRRRADRQGDNGSRGCSGSRASRRTHAGGLPRRLKRPNCREGANEVAFLALPAGERAAAERAVNEVTSQVRAERAAQGETALS
jgi:hypothetical protein